MRGAAIGALLISALGLMPLGKVAPSGSDSPTFLYVVAKRYDPLAWTVGGERFGAGASVYNQDATGRRPLVQGFEASADPAVSFDGKRALFAGRKKVSDPWQVWEVALESGDLRRVTNCTEDCVRPLYLTEERIVYGEKIGGRFVIGTMALSGGKPLYLTYGPESSLPTDVLHDGRILFEAAFPFGSKGSTEIYTVYSDGSGFESYRCDHGQRRHSGKQVASGDIVFPVEHGLARFTSALAKEVRIPAPQGDYAGGIAETASDEWLLPWRANGNGRFQLMWWKSGRGNLRLALQEPDSHVLEPVLVAERAIPKRHPSGLHDWPVSNLLCLNAYKSKYKFLPASIQSVRLYSRSDTGKAELLGTAPVETDGSFFVQVAGDQPLQIELVDSKGTTLKREAGWFWMRRGEQRVCVGCHAGPENSPENAVPKILLKSTVPADMTHPVTASAGGR